ncbi:MAG: hypothetical protein PWQ20_430 [Thermotogaceae bacterium]|jgi:hypothetical protein|nr:hypothetical protein [Thermotogaceae bacterium]MDN5337360.1 hypothetical protein [Thermotogaceae bacterium]
MIKKISLFAVLLLVAFNGFSMNFIIGGGYQFSTEKFQPAGWNVNLGLGDKLGDEVLFDVTFNLNATTTSSPSPTDYLMFNLDTYIPLIGRNKDSNFKAGPFLSIEYGNFHSYDSTEVSWNSSAGVGAFFSYKYKPWELTLSFSYPVDQFDSLNELSIENLADFFELRARFFISSLYRNFIDEFFIELNLSTRRRRISVSFSEPF